MTPLPIRRSEDVHLGPDPRRVITKPFVPGEEIFPDGRSRIEVILARILAMTEADVAESLRSTLDEFADRHRDFGAVLAGSFGAIADRHELPPVLSDQRKQLIGSYFTHEYSIESAALGNPSMVLAPDQSGLNGGEIRFILSLRAVGEGHVSSIEFRTGVVGPDMSISVDRPNRYVATGQRTTATHDKAFFVRKVTDLDDLNEITVRVLDGLDTRFTIADLEREILALDDLGIDRTIAFESTRILHWLASSSYEVSFPEASAVSERVLFPSGPTESHGMEDARMVRFVNDGEVVYYATYTAFDGYQILPQLIETKDFESFRIATLSGECAQHKGIALFPRKIDGRYAAMARHDNENNFLMTSTDIRDWRETEKIQGPESPWEFVQLGNCGSPLETEAGWLVITHGVGPMRRYALGALLLDLDDPCSVIGRLDEPLLVPIDEDREGYVPNVVYSCGSMIHCGHLVLPYGHADVGARMATVPLDHLLDRLAG